MTTPLLGWLHLSDIHFGDGTIRHGFDKEQVLERLIEDLSFLRSEDDISVDYVFLTGDVTFSGGCKSKDEFARAAKWLDRVLSVLGLSQDRLFIVPGNHDVQLDKDSTDQLKYLLGALRRGDEEIDNLSSDQQKVLLSRLKSYQRFAAPYGGPSTSLGMSHWWRDIPVFAGLDVPISVMGWNTALVTQVRGNEGRLQVGLGPLSHLDQNGSNRIVVALTHHPMTKDWFSDHDLVSTRFQQRVDIHLCGHVHGADIEQLRKGGRKPVLTVVSGAAHSPEGEEVGHGYSLGSLLEVDGEAVVRVWPRYFYPTKQEFDRHAELLPRGADHSEDPLGGKAKQLVEEALVRRRVPRSRTSELRATVEELSLLVSQIDEPTLTKFASDVLGDMAAGIRRLALMRETPELTAGAYYSFLNPLIEQLEAGKSIWAISTMMAVEWTDDPFEERFLKANLDAADRGVGVERIFVVPESASSRLHESPAIQAQIDHPKISTLLVIRERLFRSDSRLLSRIGAGIVAFDDEVVLVDRHNNDGQARGYATFLESEIDAWQQTYQELRTHAQVLTS